jgi:hypothetical protein
MERHLDLDLFGNPIIPDGPAQNPLGKRKRKRKDPVPRGYAAPPGTGPEGESCGTCANHAVIRLASNYHKCELMRAKWTGGGATDIRVRSPACREWRAP